MCVTVSLCWYSRERGHGVLGENLFVAQFIRIARRALHANVGSDTREHDRSETAPAQLQVEVGAVKGAPLPLGDQVVRCLNGQARSEFIYIGRQFARRRPRLVANRVQAVFGVAGDGDADPDNKSPFGTQGRGEFCGVLHDGAPVVGLRGTGHDEVLQINGDEGGLRGR